MFISIRDYCLYRLPVGILNRFKVYSLEYQQALFSFFRQDGFIFIIISVIRIPCRFRFLTITAENLQLFLLVAITIDKVVRVVSSQHKRDEWTFERSHSHG